MHLRRISVARAVVETSGASKYEVSSSRFSSKSLSVNTSAAPSRLHAARNIAFGSPSRQVFFILFAWLFPKTKSTGTPKLLPRPLEVNRVTSHGPTSSEMDLYFG